MAPEYTPDTGIILLRILVAPWCAETLKSFKSMSAATYHHANDLPKNRTSEKEQRMTKLKNVNPTLGGNCKNTGMVAERSTNALNFDPISQG